MGLGKYVGELYGDFIEEPLEILYTALVVWLISPLIIFGIAGILQAAFYNTLNLNLIVKLFEEAIIPWWASILINPIKFVLWYLFYFVITLILVHHNLIKTIKPSLKHFKSVFGK